jgi:flagellar protein FliO/FliZ
LQNAGSGAQKAMDPADWIRAIAALAITLGLLAGVALLARRFGLMQGVAPIGNKGRLKIVEQLWLDSGRTRAIILRCDGVEHLIVVSPTATSAMGTTQVIPSSPTTQGVGLS